MDGLMQLCHDLNTDVLISHCHGWQISGVMASKAANINVLPRGFGV
jgi:hypothetical protein